MICESSLCRQLELAVPDLGFMWRMCLPALLRGNIYLSVPAYAVHNVCRLSAPEQAEPPRVICASPWRSQAHLAWYLGHTQRQTVAQARAISNESVFGRRQFCGVLAIAIWYECELQNVPDFLISSTYCSTSVSCGTTPLHQRRFSRS